MKKSLIAIASALACVGMVTSAEASPAKAVRSAAAQTTNAPAAVDAATRAADLAKLGNGRLTAHQIKKFGLKPVSGAQLARIKSLQKASHGVASASTVGSYFWYTWQNARNSWSDRYYSGPYYSYPWYPYYVVYDNWKTCTYSGTSCLSAHAYTYQYYLYYYPNGTWYYYNTGGYQSNSTNYSGWGPYYAA